MFVWACVCVYIFIVLYMVQACVFTGVREDKSLCIFGAHPTVGKEGKLPPAAFSPPVSFRNTKGHILVPACFLITLPPSIYKPPFLGSCHPLLCLSAPGWLLPSTIFLFPTRVAGSGVGCDLGRTTQTLCAGFYYWN